MRKGRAGKKRGGGALNSHSWYNKRTSGTEKVETQSRRKSDFTARPEKTSETNEEFRQKLAQLFLKGVGGVRVPPLAGGVPNGLLGLKSVRRRTRYKSAGESMEGNSVSILLGSERQGQTGWKRGTLSRKTRKSRWRY